MRDPRRPEPPLWHMSPQVMSEPYEPRLSIPQPLANAPQEVFAINTSRTMATATTNASEGRRDLPTPRRHTWPYNAVRRSGRHDITPTHDTLHTVALRGEQVCRPSVMHHPALVQAIVSVVGTGYLRTD